VGAFHVNLPLVANIDNQLLRVGVAMEMLCTATETCRLVLLRWVIDVRNMWEVFMEGSHIIDHKVQLKFQMQGIGMESRWK
jgi:hypothetical protein